MNRTDVRVRECADAVVFARPTPHWGPHLLMVERSDFPGCWALPGGHIDPGEDAVEAALRELWEEAGLWVDRSRAGDVLPRRLVPDPRGTADVEYWTTPVPVRLDCDLPALRPDPGEVLRAEWVYAATLGTVCQHLEGIGGKVWEAHEPMLRDMLG